jgi:hypothetical protein
VPLNVPQQLLLDQARSDYDVFRFLSRRDVCHRIHYLQMCTEKLSKVFLWRNNHFPGFRHNTFEPFLDHLKNNRPDLYDMFGYRDVRRFNLQWASILNLARRIQNLAPAHGNNGPNPEYPWPPLTPTFSPLVHPFTEWHDWNSSIAGRRMKHFVENLLQNYAALFP